MKRRSEPNSEALCNAIDYKRSLFLILLLSLCFLNRAETSWHSLLSPRRWIQSCDVFLRGLHSSNRALPASERIIDSRPRDQMALLQPESKIRNISLSNDSRWLLATPEHFDSKNPPRVELFDLSLGGPPLRIYKNARYSTFSRQGDRYLVKFTDGVGIYDTNSGRCLRRLPAGEYSQLSSDGSKLSTEPRNGRSRMIEVFDIISGLKINQLNFGDELSFRSAVFTPDDSSLVIALSNGEILIWDFNQPENPRRVFPLPPALSQRRSVVTSLSVGSSYLAAVYHFYHQPTRIPKPVVYIWNLSSGFSVSHFKVPASTYEQPYFSPDGSLLLTRSFLGNKVAVVGLWDPQTGHQLAKFQGNFDSVQFSSDGSKIFLLERNGTLTIRSALNRISHR